LIGEGGFGVVYMTEQEKPIRRRVALKIIKLGMDTKQVIARFEAERQALAMMDHPNIARVFDAGATDTGRPYFVMELVKGIPITEYCDKNNLDTRQRLDLFIDVCKAVQHAHQKGIIHRDIKPSNVMITLHDGKPVPKIIDFGIAKATQHRLTEKTFFTEYRQFIGTPEYMSPEQAEMTGLEVDTRSDIYSLGVLLYELLTGTTPFEGDKLRSAAYDEIRRIIREDEPPKPSTRLSSLGDALSDVAKHRHVQPDQLCKIVRGDLDWVVMKSLEKDRTRRYETANEFAQDINRHLGDEPVSAGPPSAGYRLSKFVRRNRAVVTAVAAVLVVLVAGIVVSTIFAIGQALARAEAVAARVAEAQQRQIAETERDKAVEAERLAEQRREQAVAARDETEQQAKVLRAVVDFLSNDVFGKASEKQTVHELLDAASESLDGKFEDAPLVEASIHEALGTAYQSLGEYEDAEVHLERAWEIRSERGHPDAMDSLQKLLGLYCHESGREIEQRLDLRLLEKIGTGFGEIEPRTLIFVDLAAATYVLQERYDKAEALYVKGLEVRRRVLGEEHPDTLKTMSRLAQVYEKQERYDQAEPLYIKALEGSRRALGEEHPDTQKCIGELSDVYLEQERYKEAEPLLAEVLEIRRRVLGDEDPNTLEAMESLAELYEEQGRLDKAEPLLLKVMEGKRQVLGEEDLDALASMSKVLDLYCRQGRYEEAERLSVEALETCRRAVGEKDPRTLMAMAALGVVYFFQGRYDKAEPLCVEALEINRHERGEEDMLTEGLMVSLSVVQIMQGHYDEAERLYVKLLDIHRRVQGDEPWLAQQQLVNGLIELYRDQDRYDDAEALLVGAMEIQRRVLGEEHPGTVKSMNKLIDLYEAWGKPEKAEEWRAKLPRKEGTEKK